MEIKLYNQKDILNILIKYIDDHNKLPQEKTALDKKKIMETVKAKIKKVITQDGISKGRVYKVPLLKGGDSIDGQVVFVDFICTTITKSSLTVKLHYKKY